MRHRHSRLRLRHKPAYSWAMQRNLVTSVLLYESIRTTKKRAEVVQPLVERIITTSKTKEARNAIRDINKYVMDVNACKKVMELLKNRYKTRTSGFTRIVPLGARVGDGAKMVMLELVDAGTGEVIKSTTVSKPVRSKTSSRSSKK